MLRLEDVWGASSLLLYHASQKAAVPTVENLFLTEWRRLTDTACLSEHQHYSCLSSLVRGLTGYYPVLAVE